MSTAAMVLLGMAWACGAGAQPAPLSQASPLQLAADAFMGDYQGHIKMSAEKLEPVCAQVIALGGGQYQANLLSAFDEPKPPHTVLKGTLADNAVSLHGAGPLGDIEGTLRDGFFVGRVSGLPFELRHVVRESPTLGAKPPEGAIVLFDGAKTDCWVHPAGNPFIYDIAEALGAGADRVAYLQTAIFAPEKTRVLLKTGSDDGLKVLLNGREVFANNATRGISPGTDKTDVELEQGWNQLLLKVTQISGDWQAVAQITTPDEKKVLGLQQSPVQSAERAFRLEDSEGYITQWEVSGPYVQEGCNAETLFNVLFPPEQGGGVWKPMPRPPFFPQPCKWLLLDNGAMEVRKGGIMTRQRFGPHKMHIEFRLPFMPEARGQARANSGVYVQGRYEIQVLDSYGLEGLDNECGGIYKVAPPRVNMCAPPLQWQTYDITFHPAQFDAHARQTRDAVITVLHNGVPIHDNLESATTPGGVDYKLLEPGPLYLQDHGNPVWFRNIWVQEIKEGE